MRKSRPDPDKLANELAGASAFFKRPTPTPAEQPPALPASEPATPSELTTDTRKRVPTATPEVKAKPATEAFDLNHQPTTKYTLMFTEDELEALDDAKTHLRRRHGLKVAKNDLVRCGLYHILASLDDPNQADPILDLLKSKKPL